MDVYPTTFAYLKNHNCVQAKTIEEISISGKSFLLILQYYSFFA